MKGTTMTKDSENVATGLTVGDVAMLYRVSPDKVRSWIKKGELSAVNTADAKCARPRFVILPHQLAEFETGRIVATAAKKVARRKKIPAGIDYYP
jgi:hypothetical protein